MGIDHTAENQFYRGREHWRDALTNIEKYAAENNMVSFKTRIWETMADIELSCLVDKFDKHLASRLYSPWRMMGEILDMLYLHVHAMHQSDPEETFTYHIGLQKV